MAAKRLAGPAQVSNSAATKYTVGAGLKAVVRHIHVFNASGSAATFTLSIGTDAAATRLFDGLSIPANQPFDFYCYLPMAAAEIIQALSGTNNVLTLTINGDESVA
jgi:hypothetical protein